jgi:hypothetical protein
MSKRFLAILAAGAAFAFVLADTATADSPTPQQFACCSNTHVATMVEEYIDLEESLHNRNDGQWQPAGECYALAGALSNVSTKVSLSADLRVVVTQLVNDVDAVKDGKAEQVRPRFDAISRGVMTVARAHQGGNTMVAEAYCPSVGSWLQEGASLHHPYGTGACGVWR